LILSSAKARSTRTRPEPGDDQEEIAELQFWEDR
jgi:hypothetical protein